MSCARIVQCKSLSGKIGEYNYRVLTALFIAWAAYSTTAEPEIMPKTLPTNIPDVKHSKSETTSTKTLTNYNYPSLYEGHLSDVLIPHSQIQSHADKLASIIHSDYPITEPLVLLSILKGASPFFHLITSALSRLKHPYVIEFTRISSYVGTQSSADIEVKGNQLLDVENLKGRHVLIVEDIVDTGNTMAKFLPILKGFSPKSYEICTMLTKRLPNKSAAVVPKYVAFSVPNEFVVGFGLDYNEMYRDLEDVWIMSKKGIEFGGMEGLKIDCDASDGEEKKDDDKLQ